MSACCEPMDMTLNMQCQYHPVGQCPDQVIVPIADGGLGIPIHDGGSAALEINYCPWCGTPTTIEAWDAKSPQEQDR
jgi:hypothetical protein